LRQADDLPLRLEQAETRRFYAGMLLDRDGPGDGEEAARFATEAAAVYRRMGVPGHVTLTNTSIL
jgi:hypothetical protein